MDCKNCMFQFNCVEAREFNIWLIFFFFWIWLCGNTQYWQQSVKHCCLLYFWSPKVRYLIGLCYAGFILECGRRVRSFHCLKIIPLPFSGPNSTPISFLLLVRLWKGLFMLRSKTALTTVSWKLSTFFRKAHSTCTALTQMTGDWLREILSSLITQNILIKKLKCNGCPSTTTLMKSYLCSRS